MRSSARAGLFVTGNTDQLSRLVLGPCVLGCDLLSEYQKASSRPMIVWCPAITIDRFVFTTRVPDAGSSLRPFAASSIKELLAYRCRHDCRSPSLLGCRFGRCCAGPKDDRGHRRSSRSPTASLHAQVRKLIDRLMDERAGSQNRQCAERVVEDRAMKDKRASREIYGRGQERSLLWCSTPSVD